MSTADVLPHGITGPIMEIPEGKYPSHEAIDFTIGIKKISHFLQKWGSAVSGHQLHGHVFFLREMKSYLTKRASVSKSS